MLNTNNIVIHSFNLRCYTKQLDFFSSILSDTEIAKAKKLRFARDKNNYIISHALMRQTLADHLSCQPQDLNFHCGKYGKPFLPESHDLYFNLTHSKDYALLAVAKGYEVGIDIEYIAEKDNLIDLVERFFSPREYHEYQQLAANDQLIAFYRGWTCKEAFIKALGQGLSCSLDTFDVVLTPHKQATIAAINGSKSKAAKWQLYALDSITDYAAAVAWRGDFRKIVYN